MAELTTLARPYAKAAFEHARKAKHVQAWSDTLALASSISQTGAVKNLFASPNLTAEQKSTTFISLCKDELNPQQDNFFRILAENNRLGLLSEIQRLFELLKADYEKAVEVDIQTAFEISPELEKKLGSALTRKLERQVSLQTSVNKDLLAGALIRAGDMVIDASVRGRLNKLADAMSN